MKKYKDTLNLPKTDYPIKLKPEREVELVEQWKDLYSTVQESRSNSAPFVLHDGPPYANGNLHHGHILNKVLKDIVVKYNNLMGRQASFKPGWDCHGLPIETAVDKKLGPKRHDMSKDELQQAYRDYADKFVNVQREEFKRLGVIADWDNPYKTMDPAYETQTVTELAKFVDAGLVYKDLKPVFWCPTHRTALANGDIEYKNHTSKSVFVAFKLCKGDDYLAVWTTTPWTLLANQAVAVNPKEMYTAVLYEGKRLHVAVELVDKLSNELDTKLPIQDRPCVGSYFEDYEYTQPLTGKVCPVVFSDHVTTESGTGCVHIAPGHGEDDFRVGKKYGLEVAVAIGDNGKSTYNLNVSDTTDEVIKNLGDAVLKVSPFNHSYPYSSRSNKPVITKATNQWFISLDKPYNDGPTLRERALAALDEVQWVPEHGYNRLKGMLESRPDWCISRQRSWGVPITVNGRQEPDILDVWFDSGVSNAAVMGSTQVDLYLEGSDQHRGWFQSTLLASLGANEVVPYKAVLTHGFVVGDDGEKLSKSKKNYVDPFKYIKSDGVEILRLWVASAEYRNDISVSKNVLDVVKQTHHKIRNSVRFLLSNLYDYDPEAGHQADKYLDKYILTLWREVYNECMKAYEEYSFHRVVKLIENFCVNDLSTFYFDVIKDHMYCDNANSFNRRSTQAAIYTMAKEMIPLLAPILSFSMEDAWKSLGKEGSVHNTFLPKRVFSFDKELVNRYNSIRKVKAEVNKLLEDMRNSKEIGAFTEADAWVHINDTKGFSKAELARLLGVSKAFPGEQAVAKATGTQCQRCWNYHFRLVKDTDVCPRCQEALDEGTIS